MREKQTDEQYDVDETVTAEGALSDEVSPKPRAMDKRGR